MKPKVLVIVTTTRKGRNGRKVADWYISEAQKKSDQLDFEIYDIADLKLGMFDEPLPPAMHQFSDLQKKIESDLLAADGFVFITGEYNHSMPGTLKNFLDYTSTGWQRKPAAYVGYGSIGALRSISGLIGVMAYFNVASLVQQLNIVKIWEALDENGNPKPEYINGDMGAQIEELTWWVKTLKAGRDTEKKELI